MFKVYTCCSRYQNFTFLWLNDIPLHVYTTFFYSFIFWFDGLLAVVNNAAISLCVPAFTFFSTLTLASQMCLDGGGEGEGDRTCNLSVLDNAPTNWATPTRAPAFILFECISRSGIVGSYANSLFNFLRSCQTVPFLKSGLLRNHLHTVKFTL